MGSAKENRARKFIRRQIDSEFPAPTLTPAMLVKQRAATVAIRSTLTKAKVRRWMYDHYQDFMECGELQCTQLVEQFCISNPGHDHWLDDSTHWVWDLPIDIEDRLQRSGAI